MKHFSFKLVWQALKKAFSGFSEDKITKLSASLAYYTVFSMGPLLIVIISVCGLFLGKEAVQGTIQNQISGFIGADAAKQIQEIIKNVAISGKGAIATTIGIITLLIGATSVFGEIQDSMNGIWGLKPRPKAGIMKLVKDRLLSFGIIGSLGFLLLVSLAATTVVEGIGDRLKAMLPNVTVVVFYIINLALNIGVITVLFAVIFKELPDAKIKWKNIWPGAIATALLFLLGKFAISFYISKSNVGSTYGAAGSLVVLLLWVYYSSIILYFGAEFTKSYALLRGAKITPNSYAEWNKEPVVPGSDSKSGASPSEQRHRHPHLHLHGQPKIQPVREEGPFYSNHVKKEAGMGTLLVGLALYFFNTGGKK
ncbi:MAG TPA: YihY/virulence factor BrkB family protein [Flavisolibacter sp.]|nr:YihY/virulence factor BrkB family protein [Flavisolibacter sp.]